MTWRHRSSRLDRWLDRAAVYRSGPALHHGWCVIQAPSPAGVYLNLGGGPGRINDRCINVNLQPLADVDVLADAHALPMADGSVQAVYLDAVLEHVRTPEQVVREIARVLVVGGEVFSVAPFLQVDHPDPAHDRNFTLAGHRRLFTDAGLSIVADGVCAGPMTALADLLVWQVRVFVRPVWLRRVMDRLMRLLLLPVRALDLLANRSRHAHRLASTTFVRARRSEVELDH